MKKDTIIYLDDERENLDVFYYMFREEFFVHTTTSTSEAIDLLNTLPVKVMLCDQRMPGLQGIEFIQQIQLSHPDVVPVLITAFSEFDVAIDAINNTHIYRFIQKPWNQKEVKVIINQAIERYNLFAERDQLLQDLTTQNEQLKKEKLKAEESARLKAAFLGNISHELRTPMNAILGFSSLLVKEKKDTEKQELYTSMINSSCSTLLMVVDDIILLSQLQSESYTLTEEHFTDEQINRFLTDEIKKVEDQYLLKNITLKVDEFNFDGTITTYWSSIQKSILKILDNAFKFTPNQGNVNLTLKILGYEIICSISDSGIGIPIEEQEKIFEEFYQVSPFKNSVVSGNGIGLSISKALINQIGGTITVNSEPDKGSEFTIQVPIKSSPNSIKPTGLKNIKSKAITNNYY